MEENRRLQENLDENLRNLGFSYKTKVKVSDRLKGALCEKIRGSY
jgi:hypothetical protein